MRRVIGNSGIEVNAIGLGGMPLSIQGRPDERTALAVISAFVENGGDFIDTAISYCLDNDDLGHNERLDRESARGARPARRGRRDQRRAHAAATAAGTSMRRRSGCGAAASRACAISAEPISLYYLHAVDSAVPFADSLGELVKLKDEGKIVNIGLSNVSAKQLDEGLELAPIAAVQNRCNLFERRDFDNGLVEHCRKLGVAYVPYSPVGGHFGHRRVAQDATLARIAAKHSATSVRGRARVAARARAPRAADPRSDEGRERHGQPRRRAHRARRGRPRRRSTLSASRPR